MRDPTDVMLRILDLMLALGFVASSIGLPLAVYNKHNPIPLVVLAVLFAIGLLITTEVLRRRK